jgi:ribosomal protein L34E
MRRGIMKTRSNQEKKKIKCPLGMTKEQLEKKMSGGELNRCQFEKAHKTKACVDCGLFEIMFLK